MILDNKIKSRLTLKTPDNSSSVFLNKVRKDV